MRQELSLSRFRARCYDYETTHNVDLYRNCVKGLSASIAKMMKIDGRIRRMDSTMIEANIRKLSRMELIYTCISKLVKYMDKTSAEFDRERFGHYLDPDDYNRFIYHSKSEDVDRRMLTLLSDADVLMELCKEGYDQVTEYRLFSRCMSEQTVGDDSERRLKTKADGDMDSSLMQNPSDPDATFRQKTEQCLLSFDRNHCVNCPFQDQCKPKIFKRVAKKAVSKKSAMRAKYIEQKSTEKFKLLAKLRNGVETIPSLLKNKYDVNKMPVRGLQRSKFFFGSKVCAINFNKLFRFRYGTGHYAQNSIFA